MTLTVSLSDAAPLVLLADDDRLILATLSQGLRNAGFSTLEAATGSEALRLCVDHPVSVAVLDYDLPDMTGVQAARGMLLLQSFPIMFLSAYSDESIVRQAADGGAMSFLVKPIDTGQLVPAIRTALLRFAELDALRGQTLQLQSALKANRATSVVVGLLMARLGLAEQRAFDVLRRYCRHRGVRVEDVAMQVLAEAGDPETLQKIVSEHSTGPG